jgi:hypothetical protein
MFVSVRSLFLMAFVITPVNVRLLFAESKTIFTSLVMLAGNAKFCGSGFFR